MIDDGADSNLVEIHLFSPSLLTLLFIALHSTPSSSSLLSLVPGSFKYFFNDWTIHYLKEMKKEEI